MIIYMATNRVNGKLYIGQTVKSLKIRKRAHITTALRGVDIQYFGRAIRKYGQNNFDWEILHKCNDIDELNRLEIYYIKLYNTFEDGYNLTKGGLGKLGYRFSDEAKQKKSESLMGKNNPMYGKKVSDETKRKLSEMNKGKNNPFYGKKHSEEAKEKVSKARSGKVFSETHKKNLAKARKGRFRGKNSPGAVAVIANNKYFDTRKAAAKYLNIDPGTIRRRIKRQVPGYQYA